MSWLQRREVCVIVAQATISSSGIPERQIAERASSSILLPWGSNTKRDSLSPSADGPVGSPSRQTEKRREWERLPLFVSTTTFPGFLVELSIHVLSLRGSQPPEAPLNSLRNTSGCAAGGQGSRHVPSQNSTSGHVHSRGR